MEILEKRAKDLGVDKKDIEKAIRKFLSMLTDDELKMFMNDMLSQGCGSCGSCGCK